MPHKLVDCVLQSDSSNALNLLHLDPWHLDFLLKNLRHGLFLWVQTKLRLICSINFSAMGVNAWYRFHLK